MENIKTVLKLRKYTIVTPPVAQNLPPTVRQSHPPTVRQRERNPIETQEKHTGAMCVNHISQGYKIRGMQLEYIMRKTGANAAELEKALRILSKSRTKNVIKVLLTAAFYKGECILEEDQADIDPESQRINTLYAKYSDDQARRWEQSQKWERDRVQREAESRQALTWFQALSDSCRETIKTQLIERIPYVEGRERVKRGDFSPLVMAYLCKIYKENASHG